MIARIKTERGTVYDTIVFALLLDGWDSKMIGFDEELRTLRELPYYYLSPERHIHQLFAFIDSDEEGWVEKKSVSGVEWLVSRPDLLEKIHKGEPLPKEILTRCKAMQNEMDLPEWREVVPGKAREDLLLASGNFHDGVISAVEWIDDSACVSIEVWGAVIHLRLEHAELSENCVVGYGNMGEILDCSVFFENGRVYWADDCDFEHFDELNDEFCYFSGTRLYWKIELD